MKIKKRTGLFSDGLSISKIKVPKSKLLDTNGYDNFTKGRKYDTDIDRLSRRSVQNELSTTNINKEYNKMRKELI